MDDKRLIAALAWRLAEEYGKQIKPEAPEQVTPGEWSISLPLQIRVKPYATPLSMITGAHHARIEYEVSPQDVFAEIEIQQPDGSEPEYLRATSSELLENEEFVNIVARFVNEKMIERHGPARRMGE